MLDEIKPRDSLTYHPGLSKVSEMVISSHFMHRISQDASLTLYDDDCFKSKQLVVSKSVIVDELVPILLAASAQFCQQRAEAASRRAVENFENYGLSSSTEVGVPEMLTEALLHKEFSRNGEKYNSRAHLNSRIRQMIDERAAIDMTMPALPFKIPSPLKSRGPLPDLGEINFLLNIYEIARTLEIICACGGPAYARIKVRFTLISDGSRFDEIVNQPASELEQYRDQLASWINVLGIADYIQLVDYKELLHGRLPRSVVNAKSELYKLAHESYSRALWPVFDPDDMRGSFESATRVELDPEYENDEGRFVSLFKSLVYTLRYKTLQQLSCSEDERARIYRELTANIFRPYHSDVGAATNSLTHRSTNRILLSASTKEQLRRSMLAEAWEAAISYISEIKSDRDLAEDPILVCLPGYLRWTIHAKHGQLAIATPPILGISVQPWAGSAVFRPTGKRQVRLCTLPLLMLEATSAIPVMLREEGGSDGSNSQPLFYVDKELGVSDVSGLLSLLRASYTRRRFS